MSVFSFTVAQLDGRLVSLGDYTGHSLLIVNTASRCSFNQMNIALLSNVHKTYADRGFSVLAFPCSQFAAQEPLTSCELEDWRVKEALPFPVFGKVDVKGPKASPLWQFLHQQLGPVQWNYTKFLCDRGGRPVKKLDPSSTPAAVDSMVASLLR